MNRHLKILALTALTVTGAIYAFCFFRPIWDVDIFWHIKAGQWIVENGELPSTDIFSSVDPERPWHTFQWGYEVMVYGLDRVGGLTLVRGVHAGAIWAAFALLAWFLWRRTRSPLAVLLGVVPLLVGFADRVRCRPDAFNLFLTVLALPILLKRRWTRRHFLSILGITAVWANLHGGGVLLLFVLMAGRWFGLLLEDLTAAAKKAGEVHAPHAPPVPWKELFREGGLSIAPVMLAFVMPGFARGVYQAFFMLGPSREFIPEWMNTFHFLFEAASTWHERLAALGPLLWLLVLMATSAVRVVRGGWHLRCFHWRLIGLAIPLGILGLEHVRFAWLGGLIATLVAWVWVSSAQPTGRRTHPPRTPSPLDLMVVAGALFLGLMNVNYFVNHLHGGAPRILSTIAEDLEPDTFPAQATDFLEDVGACGGALNHAPWGGYLLYRLWPCLRVYTDGRGNFTDIETHVLTTIQSPGTRRRAIDAAWRRAPFEVLIHPMPFPWFDYERYFWILVYRDETAWVYLRNVPKNDPVFERVVAWYADRGLDLGGTSHSDTRAFEFERRIRRFHGLRMLGESWARRLEAEQREIIERAPPDTEQQAWHRLARLYFDLGLHRECQEVLSEASQRFPQDPRGLLILIRSLTADGARRKAQVLAETLIESMRSDPAVRSQFSGREMSIFNIIRVHLWDVLGDWQPSTDAPPVPGAAM